MSRNGTLWIGAGSNIFLTNFSGTGDSFLFRCLTVDCVGPGGLLSPVQDILLCRYKEAWTVHRHGEIAKWYVRRKNEERRDKQFVFREVTNRRFLLKDDRSEVCIMRGNTSIAQAHVLYDGSLIVVSDTRDLRAVRVSRFFETRQRVALAPVFPSRPFRVLSTNSTHDLIVVVSLEQHDSTPSDSSVQQQTWILNVFGMATTVITQPQSQQQ